MKVSILAGLVGALCAWGGAVYAGGSCCPAAKATMAAVESTAKDSPKMCGAACFDGVELTADQLAKVDRLMEDCAAGSCSVSAAQDLHQGLQQVLTSDQLKAMQDNCRKNGCVIEEVSG